MSNVKLVSESEVVNNDVFHTFLMKQYNAKPFYFAGAKSPFMYKIPLSRTFGALVFIKDSAGGKGGEVELNLTCVNGIINRYKTIANTPETFLLALNNFKKEILSLKKFMLNEKYPVYITPIGLNLLRLSLHRTSNGMISGLPNTAFIMEDDGNPITGVKSLDTTPGMLGHELYAGKNLYYTIVHDLRSSRVDRFTSNSAEIRPYVLGLNKNIKLLTESGEELISVSTDMSIKPSSMFTRVGVVGFSNPNFDRHKAAEYLAGAFSSIQGKALVVSGLTDLGIPALAYRVAKNFSFKTAGIACKKAEDYDLYPVDVPPIIVGDNWGDESKTFLDSIDMLVRVGGGKQSLEECNEAKKQGIKVVEYDL
jgi:hypothetical protein